LFEWGKRDNNSVLCARGVLVLFGNYLQDIGLNRYDEAEIQIGDMDGKIAFRTIVDDGAFHTGKLTCYHPDVGPFLQR
jgi:hypothetical protein